MINILSLLSLLLIIFICPSLYSHSVLVGHTSSTEDNSYKSNQAFITYDWNESYSYNLVFEKSLSISELEEVSTSYTSLGAEIKLNDIHSFDFNFSNTRLDDELYSRGFALGWSVYLSEYFQTNELLVNVGFDRQNIIMERSVEITFYTDAYYQLTEKWNLFAQFNSIRNRSKILNPIKNNTLQRDFSIGAEYSIYDNLMGSLAINRKNDYTFKLSAKIDSNWDLTLKLKRQNNENFASGEVEFTF